MPLPGRPMAGGALRDRGGGPLGSARSSVDPERLTWTVDPINDAQQDGQPLAGARQEREGESRGNTIRSRQGEGDPANRGNADAARSRLRDRRLWVLAALIVLCVIARLVAQNEALHNGSYDCFPGCSFDQQLSNIVTYYAPILAVLFAIWVAVRWVRLGLRPVEGGVR